MKEGRQTFSPFFPHLSAAFSKPLGLSRFLYFSCQLAGFSLRSVISSSRMLLIDLLHWVFVNSLHPLIAYLAW